MASKPMTAPVRAVKEYTFIWEGRDRNGRTIRGEKKPKFEPDAAQRRDLDRRERDFERATR